MFYLTCEQKYRIIVLDPIYGRRRKKEWPALKYTIVTC